MSKEIQNGVNRCFTQRGMKGSKQADGTIEGSMTKN